MSEMTYTECGLCKRTQWYPKYPTCCPCVRSSTPGLSPTGVTVGQIERMVERERSLQGDPGVDAVVRRTVLAKLRQLLEAAEKREGIAAVATLKNEQCRDDWQAAIEERDEALNTVDDLRNCLRNFLNATERHMGPLPSEELVNARAWAMLLVDDDEPEGEVDA